MHMSSPTRQPAPATSVPRGGRVRPGIIALLAVTVAAQALFVVHDAPPAQAQNTPATLLSNLNQVTFGNITTSNASFAQGFTTGGNAGGYTLSSIEMNLTAALDSTASAKVSVELWSAAAGGGPNMKIADLDVPNSMSAGTVSFTAPGDTVLMSGTSYHVVAYTDDATNFSPQDTSSTTLDSGAADGWSLIARHWYTDQQTPDGATWTQIAPGYGSTSAKIAVKGTAREPPALVSNLEQTSGSVGQAGVNQQRAMGQGFVTGSNPGGYTLSGIEFKTSSAADSAQAATAKVELWSASGSSPGSFVATLANPSTFSAGTVSFAAPPGTTLAPDTRYFVVAYTSTSFQIAMQYLDNDDETGAAGWSIDDVAYEIRYAADPSNPGAATWSVFFSGHSLRIAVKGFAASGTTPTVSSDADLSGLAVHSSTDGSDFSTALTLNETVDAATTAYTASVANAVTDVKVTPTVSDTGKATVTVGKSGDTPAVVGDGVQSDSIALEVGSNVIEVIVTAEDASTKTYTVTITRAAVVPSVSLSASSPVTEGAGVTVTATLSSALTSPVTIPVTLSAGTASSGDYGSLASITIAANQTAGTGTVATTGDTTVETDETFTVSLDTAGLPSSVAAGSPSTVTVTIDDNDLAAAPGSLRAKAGDAKLDVSWSAPAAQTGALKRFDVHYTSAPKTGSGAVTDDAAAQTVSVSAGWVDANHASTTLMRSIEGLVNGTQHRVRVRAVSAAGNGAWAHVTGRPAAPAQSSNADLSALSGATSTDGNTFGGTLTLVPAFDKATVAYAASVPNAVTHVKLTPTADDAVNASVKVGVSGSLTAVNSGSASAGIAVGVGDTAISVEVTAQDASVKTYTVTVTRAAAAMAPAAPTGLAANAGDTVLAPTWTAPPGAVTGYEVHYTSAPKTGTGAVGDDAGVQTGMSADPDDGWVAVAHSGTTASARITGLDNGTAYRVRVRAVNAVGSGAWAHASGVPSAGPSVSLTSNDADGRVDEGAGSVTLTVTLSEAPSSDATVTLGRVGSSTASLTSDWTVSATPFTITAGTTTGTATLRIVDDRVDEGDETLVLTADVQGYTQGRLSLVIVDDDTAGVTVRESTTDATAVTARTVEKGETVTYAVVLDSQPTANVTVTPTSSATAKATVSPRSRTFTATNWSTPQTFMVAGVEVGTSSISHAAAGADAKYGGMLSIGGVGVTVERTKTYEITAAVEVDEDVMGGSAELTVTLGRDAPAGGLALGVAYGNLGTTTGADRGAAPTSVTVAGGSKTATLSVPITDDELVEGNEQFSVRLSTAVSGWGPASAGKNVATVTIDDDEDDPGVAKIAFHGTDAASTAKLTKSAAENVSGGTVSVPVTVSHLPQADTEFTVEVQTAGTRRATECDPGASPAVVGDFCITTKSVTFGPATARTQNVTVAITNDARVEFDETISLRIADSAAALGTHYTRHAQGRLAAVTIEDDETDAGPKIAFGSNAAGTTVYTRSHNEPAQATVAVTLSALPEVPTVFEVQVTGGTATECDPDASTPVAGDYCITTKTVTFAADSTDTALSKSVSIAFENDLLVEEDQTIRLSIAAADATPDDLGDLYGRHTAASTATVTILDDEARAAKIAFGAAAGSVLKSVADADEDAATKQAVFPITLSALPEVDTAFTVTVLASGTATECDPTATPPVAGDYCIATKTFTFTSAGALTQNLVIALVNDMLVENDQTVELQIAATGSGLSAKYARHAQGALARATIVDDDRDDAKISLGRTLGSSSPAVFPVKELDEKLGTPGEGASVPIFLYRSHLAEGDVTFGVDVLDSSTARGSDDPDNPAGNPADFTVPAGGLEVEFLEAHENLSDLLFVAVHDDFVEEDVETVDLRLAAADASPGAVGDYADLGDYYQRDPLLSNARIDITSNDQVSSVSLAVSARSDSSGNLFAVEGQSLTVTATADIAVGPDGWAVTASSVHDAAYRAVIANGCAVQGNYGGFACPNDFRLPAPFTIPEGQTQATAALVLVSDSRAESGTERLPLSATARRRGRMLATNDLLVAVSDTAAGISLGTVSVGLIPGETAEYTVSLRGQAPTANVVITPASSDSDKATVSCAADPCKLTFTPDNWNQAQTVTVTAVAAGDATIGHTAASTDSVYGQLASLGQVAVKVDAASKTFRIAPAAEAAEGETAELAITLGDLAPTGGLAFAIDRSREHNSLILSPNPPTRLPEAGLADADADLTAPAATVTVPAGKRRVVLADALAADSLAEADEHYYVVISTTAAGWTAVALAHPASSQTCAQDAACARVEIGDPDRAAATVAFAESAVRAPEDAGTIHAAVTVSALPHTAVTFTVEAVAGGTATAGADYTVATAQVTFGPASSDTTEEIVVAVVDDTLVEGDETVELRITPAGSGGFGDHYRRDPARSRLRVTIADDDGSVHVTPTALPIATGTSAQYTVRLRGAQPTADVTVTPTSTDTTKATVSCTGADPCVLTFTPDNWNQAQTVTVAAVGSGSAGIDHTLASSDAAYPSTLSVASVAVTVTDQAAVSLTAAPNPVTEGTAVTVTAELTAPLAADAVIPLVIGGAAGDDAETGDHGTLANITIRAGDTAGTGIVTTAHDDDTDDETFTVALGSLPAGLAAASPDAVTVTIDDDDTPLGAPSALTATPGDGRLTLRWPRPAGTTISGYDVHYTSADPAAVADDAAASGADPTAGWVDRAHTGTATSVTIDGLDNGTAYRIRVRAANSAEHGPWATRTATPRPGTTTTVTIVGPTGGGPTGGGGGGGGSDRDEEDAGKTTRLWGADRYATSLAVAQQVAELADGKLDTVVIAGGHSWADALVAGPLAGKLDAAVLLTAPGGLDADTVAWLGEVGVSEIIAVGDTDRITDEALEALAGIDGDIERITADDPHAMSAAVARRIGQPQTLGPLLGRTVIVASSRVFADALAAGPLAAAGPHPILLTGTDGLHPEVAAYLAEFADHVIIMGGTAAVTQTVEDQIRAIPQANRSGERPMAITRLGGKDRYSTAVVFARWLTTNSALEGRVCFVNDTVGLATGTNAADAAASAPLLARTCTPLVLTEPDRLPPVTASYLRRAAELLIFGGRKAISDDAIDEWNQ